MSASTVSVLCACVRACVKMFALSADVSIVEFNTLIKHLCIHSLALLVCTHLYW